MRNRSSRFFSASLRLCGLLLLTATAVVAQSVPAPKDVLGWTPGDDRKLASWAQVIDYFKKLDAASDRVIFQEIGKSTMGAPFVYATISSPANLKNLEKYKQINAKLADPRMFKSDDKVAQQLIKQGKTIVVITCSIHSTEVGGYLSSMLIAYRLASSNEPEIKKILDNTIILLVPSLNPDGVDIVNNWYQKTLGTKFEGTDPPELYHKYTGHDNNRDWYAFTQVETQLTVDKILNPWHPQIVHDIHQQGAFGSRLFLPPYMDPVEPNVPKQIVEGYTELGKYISTDLRSKGFQGITDNSTYDAWTPSRAYSHYHGGVRILSETASCKLATPITVKFSELKPGEHYDPRKEAPNFGPVWLGGEWHIRNITDYMTTAAFSLLDHAANNREHWLQRFYEIGKEAVRPRKDGEPLSYIINKHQNGNAEALTGALFRGGVQITPYAAEYVIRMDQPYGAFAKALVEPQIYPDLRDEKNNPIPPYDVTAHSLALLDGVTVRKVTKPYSFKPPEVFWTDSTSHKCAQPAKSLFWIYRSHIPVMDEGWTRWLLDNEYYASVFGMECYQSVSDRDISLVQVAPARATVLPELAGATFARAILFPDQPPAQILNGYEKGRMPDEYVGGVGKEGVANLKKFVEAGGTLIFLNRSSDFAIEQFGVPIRNVVKGLERKDFYIPGSILRTELDTTNPIAKGMPAESIAWFENGPVFEVLSRASTTPSAEAAATPPNQGGEFKNVTVIARYPSDPKQILLSGWALGAEKIAGKAALVEVTMGKGKIILFGFRPQYRGQSLATFPLFFNAISN